jgi:plasmid stabilization system protein ParE
VNYKVYFTPGALKEPDDFYDWYELQQTGLGEQFLNAFESSVHHLSQYPFAHRIRKNSLRQLIVGKFPCLIIYEISETKSVIIYRIIHAHTPPAQKRRKA